jgi:hypothetical protein
LLEGLVSKRASFAAVCEIVKQRHAVCLGPHADFASVREALISSIDYFVAVEDDRNSLPWNSTRGR